MRRYSSSRSLSESVGRVVLAPVIIFMVAVVCLIALPLVIVLYPFGVVYFLVKPMDDYTSARTRVLAAVAWPLMIVGNILALNSLASLGGMDIPALTKFSERLNRRFEKKP